jgi:hypothetical protein
MTIWTQAKANGRMRISRRHDVVLNDLPFDSKMDHVLPDGLFSDLDLEPCGSGNILMFRTWNINVS